MRIMHFRAPLVILAIQAVPYSVQPDPGGKLRVSLGYGTADYEYQTFTCAGALIDAQPVTLQSSGARIDAWPSSRFRTSAFGGRLTTDDPEQGRLFGGLVLAYEGGSFGIGGGAAHVPEENGTTVPSFYLRVGPLRTAHLRLELFPPTPVYGSTGWLRTGVGFNQIDRGPVSGIVGLAMGPYSYIDNVQPRLFADLEIPLVSHLDLGFRGQVGAGELGLQWSAALIASYVLGF